MTFALDIVNVVAHADCNRRIDIDRLIVHGGAVKDLDTEAAKYCFEDPSCDDGTRQTTVSVFATGRLLCVGANSIERARGHTRKVLEIIGSPDTEVKVHMIVLNGIIEGDVDVLSKMGRLERHWNVRFESNFLSGVILVQGGGIYMDIFPHSVPVRMGMRGPDMETIHDAVGKLESALFGGDE